MSGWGEFGWKYIPKNERVCRVCEMPITKMDDVGEVRTLHSQNKQVLMCKGCLMDWKRIGSATA